MEAHELVEELHIRQTQEQREKHLDDAEELLVGSLLDKCSNIVDGLTGGKFCENEFGHIVFSVMSYRDGPYIKPARMNDAIDIIYPVFVGADDRNDSLGQIGRKTSWDWEKESRGWVDAWITLGGERSEDIDTEPLTPEDPRWEAVFKPLEIAVMKLTEENR
jgi:hypothetical protein